MQDNSIYRDIAKRTGGDIYIGVVGPVRTGKSTFIHRFLDSIVLPNIEDEYDKQRTIDEIPQSATGRTVMTTEPKFVPDESVKINVGETELNVKMIDCVGYMVGGALGSEEDGVQRMIMTPWSEEAMPFTEAAELGTSKVIGEHSTIGMLVTTDGTITDIPREDYIEAEERVASELKKLGKPFAIVLNSAHPGSDEAKALALELEEKYGVPVALVSCPDLNSEDIREILALVLGEFPIKELRFKLPDWTLALPSDHRLRCDMLECISRFTDEAEKIGDISPALDRHTGIKLERIDAGDGTGEMSIPLSDETYYETLAEVTGLDVTDKKRLFSTVNELANVKKKYDKIADALADVESKGYGIVMPTADEMRLDEPRLVKQANGYGVKVSARAESIHMIKTGIRADLCPVVGSAEQSEEVVKYLISEYEEAPERIWESNMFGKSLYDLVSDGMKSKLEHMPDESREKLGETLERIINEGAGGLLCILL
ncbi:MAG: stage IV sporulation protein A [Clostridia bacterium]|nr:stage IV sporulation protein A [Clostridia bacterium]